MRRQNPEKERLFREIADHLRVGLALDRTDITTIYTWHGYSPGTAKNFFSEREILARITGVNIVVRRVALLPQGARVAFYTDRSLPVEQTDFADRKQRLIASQSEL